MILRGGSVTVKNAGASPGPDGRGSAEVGEARHPAGGALRLQGAAAGGGGPGDGHAPPPGEADGGGRHHRAHDVHGERPRALYVRPGFLVFNTRREERETLYLFIFFLHRN